jgi:hypothetical protein
VIITFPELLPQLVQKVLGREWLRQKRNVARKTHAGLIRLKYPSVPATQSMSRDWSNNRLEIDSYDRSMAAHPL